MRLWHQFLIPYLPQKQLLTLHQECSFLRGKGWKKRNEGVYYVNDHSYRWLVAYHWKVIDEMEKRGHKVYKDWKKVWYRGKYCCRLDAISYDFELDMVQKVYSKSSPIYPEHNDDYLKECLGNLKSKGIYIDVEKGKTQYICSTCKRLYETEKEASECEVSHTKPVRFVDSSYGTMFGDKTEFPESICIEFDNGTKIKYYKEISHRSMDEDVNRYNDITNCQKNTL